MAKRFATPYLHFAIPNFLSEQKYNQLKQAYSKLQFFQKQSDLFHFYQTNELNDEPTIQFFKEDLNRQFGKLNDLSDTFYNIFASYYFKGDYLLCHDDVVDDRKYAFSYYLEDHPSGQLVLYDDTATKIVKKISVKKNLLVIFQVSNISYHQVAYTSYNGRKAVTGWLNIRGQAGKRQAKKIEEFKANVPRELLKYPLEENLEEEEFYHFPQIQYCFDAKGTSQAGPFFQRKATRLDIENNVVFDLKGYELFSADFFKFDNGDYILLNDPINSLGENILDVFIVQLPENVENSNENLIQVVDENGSTSGIPYINNSVFMIHRKSKNYFIDRVEQGFFLGHLMYRKKAKKSKKDKQSKEERTRSQIVSIRKRMMSYNQDKNEEGKSIDHLQKSKHIKKEKSDHKKKKSNKLNKHKERHE